MNNSSAIRTKYSHLLVVFYFLFSVLVKEGRLFFLKSPVFRGIINALYYLSLLLLYINVIQGGKLRIKKPILNYIIDFSPLLLLYFICEVIALLINPQYSLQFGTANVLHFLSLYFKYLIMIPTIFLMYDMRREKVMETLADAMIINQIIVIASNLIEYGLARTITDMFSLFTSFFYTSESVFEVDGPTYCCGIILVYYLFNKHQKIPRWKFAFLLFAFFVGRKRIAIFAFLIVIILKYMIRSVEFNKKRIRLFSIVFSIGILMYIALLYNSRFFEIMSHLGIGLSGRSFLYKYFIDRSAFSITHLPWGLGAVEMVFLNTSYTQFAGSYIALALHNDLLRLYIELGFVGFFAWLIIMTYHLPSIYLKRCGSAGVKEYIPCAIFCFIIYMVSNSFFSSPLLSLLILAPLSISRPGDNNMKTLKTNNT